MNKLFLKSNSALALMIAVCSASVTLAGCGKSEPEVKTGAIPQITTGPDTPPSSLQAKKAYLAGFKARYDIPVLEYPPEIKARVEAARLKKLRSSEKLMKLNMAVVSKAMKTKTVQRQIGNDAAMNAQLAKMLDSKSPQNVMAMSDQLLKYSMTMSTASKSKVALDGPAAQAEYDRVVKYYPGRVTGFKVDNCIWREMSENYRKGVMTKVHKLSPTHAYNCGITVNVRSKTGAIRPRDYHAYFVKPNATADWLYFGGYMNVGAEPRRFELNPAILKNPEKAVRSMSIWDSIR